MNYEKYKISEKTFFAFVAIIFCLLLSFRVIPSLDSDNDTGRYVFGFNNFCQGEKYDGDLLNKEISYNFFNSVFYPICYLGSDRVFIFAVSIICPLMFLVGVNWKSGSILWASSVIFSVYGIELMTNAMRQELAMALFFYSIVMMGGHRIFAYFLGMLSAVAHSSVMVYFPLILLMDIILFKRLSVKKFFVIFILFIILALIVLGVDLSNFSSDFNDVSGFYEEIYIDGSSKIFNLFFISPLVLIFLARVYFDRSGICLIELLTFVYSLAVIFVCFNFFSAIVYRFVLFSVVLQIYVVLMFGRYSLYSGGLVLFLMVMQLVIFAYSSKNYMVFIYG